MVDTPPEAPDKALDAVLPLSHWVEIDLLEVRAILDRMNNAATPTWNSARGTL